MVALICAAADGLFECQIFASPFVEKIAYRRVPVWPVEYNAANNFET